MPPLPYLSLAMIARDPEGADVLDRCLRSVLERPNGPMVDEVVVVLAGRPNEKVRAVAERHGARVHDLPSDVPLTETGGIGDFAAARNYSFSLCKGTWILWLDCDDVVPSTAHVRTFEVTDRCPLPDMVSTDSPPNSGEPKGVTLKDYLRALPPRFTAVRIGYHYAHDHEGALLQATVPPERLVRWRAGWTWETAGLRHHEFLAPIPPHVPGFAALEKGFFVDHWPTRPVEERRQRNLKLLEAARLSGIDNWRLRYWLAREAERIGDRQGALDHDEACVGLARSEEERYMTLHCMTRVLRSLGRAGEALNTALLAHHVFDERAEALADLVHCCVDTGDVGRALREYERFRKATGEKLQRGIEWNAYETELWPHVAASRAYLLVGRPDDALAAAERGLRFAPYDEAAKRAKREASAAKEHAAAKAALGTLVRHALRRDAPPRALALLRGVPFDLENDPETLALVREAEGAAGTDAPTNPTVEAEVAAEKSGSPKLGVIYTEYIEHANCQLSIPDFEEVLLALPYGRPADAGPGPAWTPRRVLEVVAPRARRIDRLERVTPIEGDDSPGAVVCRYVPGLPGVPLAHVRFYCPVFSEFWNAWTPERMGIGGSEEMVVLVARRLAALGCAVEVFTAVPLSEPSVDRGVRWRPLEEFEPREPCDVLISHRAAHLANRDDLGARRHYVWLHDTSEMHLAEQFGPEARARVTAYLLLSRWQAEHYPDVEREKVLLLPNAPEDDDRPDPAKPRQRNRVVYCSAPFRGLEDLLLLWPRVRTAVPDAELHVCYGWHVHDRMGRLHHAFRDQKERILRHLGAPGVVWHDRLPTPALGDLLKAANVFAYPTTYDETSCRAAIRAMCCGAVPVYRPRAALAETIGRWGTPVPDGENFTERFADALIQKLQTPMCDEDRSIMSADARARHDPLATWERLVLPEKPVTTRRAPEVVTPPA